jgi:hypothetical protein
VKGALLRLAEALPRYDFREFHERHIAAPPSETDEAVRAVTVDDSAVAKLLFRIRMAPGRLARRSPRRATNVPVLERALMLGFGVLGDEPGAEIAVGMIGQPWKLTAARPGVSIGPRPSSPSRSPASSRPR